MKKEAPKNKHAPMTGDARTRASGYSSPPCYAHEWETASSGPVPFSDSELSDLLNTLLEAERTGAEIVTAYMRMRGLDFAENALQEMRGIGLDNCALLSKLSETNKFDLAEVSDKMNRALAVHDPRKRIEFVVHWYSRIAQRIRDALPRITDEGTSGTLREMYVRHLISITTLEDACTRKPNHE